MTMTITTLPSPEHESTVATYPLQSTLSVRTENVMGLSAADDPDHNDSSGADEETPGAGHGLETAGGDEGEADVDLEDDDDLTVILLDNTDDNGQQQIGMDWIEQTGPEMEERRRNVLLRELRRVQRASFLHFVLLCLIPTALLLIVISTVFREDEDCKSDATFCELEPRTFINAFTTRCVCDPIPVDRGADFSG
jgi:hypothetical protein